MKLQCQNQELLRARERKVEHLAASAGRQLAAKPFSLAGDFDLGILHLCIIGRAILFSVCCWIS